MKEISTTGQAIQELYPYDRGKPVLPKVSELRRKLADKAKREPKFRFYVLYDRIYRKDVLWSAWRIVQRNDGGAGIDQQTVDDIEQYGADRLIDEIHESLKLKTYQPQPVERVYIPKGEGKTRPLGIPTIRDRIIQQACLLILEPIFEEDFLDCSYGFRPGRSAHQALDDVERNLKEGRTVVYDADLQGYFDSIPHDKLMKAVAYRIADRQVLRLIRMWLTAPIIEKDKQGQTTRKCPNRGTPQGGVISPLLSNLYLHWFDKVFYGTGNPFKCADAQLIRFADDFVIMADCIDDRMIKWVEAKIEEWMELSINREKTRVIMTKQSGTTLDFLGYSFRYDRSLRSKNGWYWNRIPSKKSLKRFRARVHEITSNDFRPIGVVIIRLNRFMRGWSNYYGTGYPSQAFNALNHYVNGRIWKFLRHLSQRPFKPPEGMSWYEFIYKKLKLYQMKPKTHVQALR
ncbi:MAG: group II intron reverse transcriptase/maturase [Planctomycetaceae bacterium]|nr:group II intron reverse transcriptase/maturase [Planctomycetaceae bacterium]